MPGSVTVAGVRAPIPREAGSPRDCSGRPRPRRHRGQPGGPYRRRSRPVGDHPVAAVVAAGATLTYSALPPLILRAVPAGQRASTDGIKIPMRIIGQVMSSVVATIIHHSSAVTGALLTTLHGYPLPFAVAAPGDVSACTGTLSIPGDSTPDGTLSADDGRTRSDRDQAPVGI